MALCSGPQYLELAIRTSQQFGYRQVDTIDVTCSDEAESVPSDVIRGRVRVGPREMVTYTKEGVELKHMEITKIRCWKVGYDLQVSGRVRVGDWSLNH